MNDPLPETDVNEDTEADRDSERLRDIHELAMKRFDNVCTPQQEMRAQALESRRFVTIPGAMWESAWAREWAENAPRPEMDKITKSLEKIETDYRENRITVNFISADQGDTDTADTLNGMFLADARHFKADQAFDNAFQEGIRGGFGAWRVTTDYADPCDPDPDDQRINPGVSIVDADQSVFFDGGSKLYDKSDANWAFIISSWPRAEAEEIWGDDCFAEWPRKGWRWGYDWFEPDIVRIAEYYVKEMADDVRLIFTQRQSGKEQRLWNSDVETGTISELRAMGWKLKRKPMKRQRVRKYIMCGDRILKDCGHIAGPNIPIVPFYGRRDYVDNLERFRGHVLKRMDDQRNLNTQMARLIEIASLSPFEKPIFDPEQMTPMLADQWARANVDRLPFLQALSLRGPDGQIIASGPIGKVEPPQVPQVTAAILQFALTSLTDQDDNADQVKANTSADAMDIAAARVDAKSQIYLDNFRQSMQRCGEIYLAMAGEIYCQSGRKVETLTMDGQQGQAELNEPTLGLDGTLKFRNDLSSFAGKVIADVQESTATKRQKTVRQALELASAFATAGATQDAVVFLYTAAENMDGEGISDLRAYARQRSIAVGGTKPTPEEEQEMQAAAAQKQQQPDPQAIALQQAIQESQSKQQLNQASAAQKIADAHLKAAQAETLDKAPPAPTGLNNAPVDPQVQTISELANARLKAAQANKLDSDVVHQHIMRGHQIADMQHGQRMAERQQEHAESQPKGETA